MDEKQEHKTWFVGGVVWGTESMVYEGNADPHVGKFVCDCDAVVDIVGDFAYDNLQHTARQIADDHNRIPVLEAKIAALADAANTVGVKWMAQERAIGNWEYIENLNKAINEARAALTED